MFRDCFPFPTVPELNLSPSKSLTQKKRKSIISLLVSELSQFTICLINNTPPWTYYLTYTTLGMFIFPVSPALSMPLCVLSFLNTISVQGHANQQYKDQFVKAFDQIQLFLCSRSSYFPPCISWQMPSCTLQAQFIHPSIHMFFFPSLLSPSI